MYTGNGKDGWFNMVYPALKHTMSEAQTFCDAAADCYGFSFDLKADSLNGFHG